MPKPSRQRKSASNSIFQRSFCERPKAATRVGLVSDPRQETNAKSKGPQGPFPFGQAPLLLIIDQADGFCDDDGTATVFQQVAFALDAMGRNEGKATIRTVFHTFQCLA